MLLCYFSLTNLAYSLIFYSNTLHRHQSNNICHYKPIHKLFGNWRTVWESEQQISK